MRSGVGGPAALWATLRWGAEPKAVGDTRKKKSGAASTAVTAWATLACGFTLGGRAVRSTVLQQLIRRLGLSPAAGQQHFDSTVSRMLQANASEGPRELTSTASAAIAEVKRTGQG